MVKGHLLHILIKFQNIGTGGRMASATKFKCSCLLGEKGRVCQKKGGYWLGLPATMYIKIGSTVQTHGLLNSHMQFCMYLFGKK